MPAVVFRVERFHTYVYGQSFMIKSDHKLLESISRKNLADAPTWLQCMMLCLQGYNLTIHYCPGKEIVIPDTLSWLWPWPSIGYCYLSCPHNAKPQRNFSASLHQWPRNVSSFWPHHYWLAQGHQGSPPTPSAHTGNTERPSSLRMVWSCKVKHSSFLLAKGRGVLHQLHQFHQGITKSQLLACGSVFWPSINKAIKEVVCQCETCTWFQSQNVAVPLTPTPTPSHPWQMCATDIFTLEGVDYLVLGNFYSKMIFIQHLPPSHSNANKVVILLKEIFSEHGIPEVLHSDNGPQYVSAQFANFCMSWGITHETSSLHCPQSNGFTEACIKSIKHALQRAKYSSADPQLTLLALWATPIDTKLPSLAELLYQCSLRITIPAKIHNKDPSSI